MKTILAISLVLLPAAALAEDLNVNLTDHRGRAMDGQVTATPTKGIIARCTTRGGRCTLKVTAGTYTVRATSLAGGSLPSKSVTIRAGRTSVATLQAAAPGTTPTSPTGSTSTTTGVTGGTTRVVGDSGGTTSSSSSTSASTGTQSVPVGGGSTTARNLGTGRIACVRGNTQDSRGRAIDGTVTFKQGDRTIGSVSTTGGRFIAYDLAAGAYSLSLRTAGGRTGTGTVTVRSGSEVTVNIRSQ